MKERENFSSKFGFILSCIGSAVGLGNIWMFSWRLGQYGGAAFLIPYFIFVFILGTTGLMGEFALGRAKGKGSLGGIKEILDEKNIFGSSIISLIPTLGVWGIFLFYNVVVGWVLKYFSISTTNNFKNIDVANYLDSFLGSNETIFWLALALLITTIVVAYGVSKGIEKANKVMMPALFIIFIILLIRSVTLPGASEGIRYLLIPKWSYLLNPTTWVMALGQAFFTVSLNGAGMVVYGSYIKKDVDIPSSAINTAFYDSLSAMLAAFIIIPAAFAFGLDPASGPTLLFITVPTIFKSMPGGHLFGIIFFGSIVFAAVSSTINMMEATSEAFMYKTKWSRRKSVLFIGVISFLVAIPLAFNIELFNNFSDIVTIYIAPFGTVISAITFFWIYGVDKALEEINIGAKRPLGNWFMPLAKYVFVFVSIIVIVFGAIYGGIG
ncbi:neurotransmitter symporter family protein [Clostridium argentinense CDC 2741]|uniref:Neurotransmitter symporter family protein n=1 Tax=Clostridium argentinense CDC 2741 TaxID=1418104 RepID=A0A0C1TZL5_9CLOT|nr:sodium-dependent transporter [Clostridium argentinense]ARC83795.1 sodium-dependent transporter [Clostridium argentinense]KIE44748.1 neurotransmitter symporter family protein [Clostridium argentinense CDC 2741]NFF39702.1 sodium-dependent transporter [Clostridium argentinense]NFP49702.1 sodium-dependent transporter [Clostridium argentinense]NFP72103.1 sodium-dependent transporter [Clostridium argentinense]